MFCQEDWHHFLAIGKAFLPILVIQISFYELLLASFVFFNYELFKGVLKYAAENPFLQDLEVG